MREREKIRVLAAYHVAGARLGKQRDFGALVTLFDTRLRAHARRLCDDGDTARDIVQEAWIAIARGLAGLRDDHAFLPWALRIVTRTAARELGPIGVTVNMVSGGLLRVTDASAATPDAVFDLIAAQTPLGRVTTPDELADAVLFFASPWSRAVTGQNLIVDGGLVFG